MEGDTKENILTLPYGQHPSSSSQVNLGGFGSFRQNSSGGINNLPHQIGESKIAVKLWLTYILCYILSLAIKFEAAGCVLKDVLKDALNFCSFWC